MSLCREFPTLTRTRKPWKLHTARTAETQHRHGPRPTRTAANQHGHGPTQHGPRKLNTDTSPTRKHPLNAWLGLGGPGGPLGSLGGLADVVIVMRLLHFAQFCLTKNGHGSCAQGTARKVSRSVSCLQSHRQDGNQQEAERLPSLLSLAH